MISKTGLARLRENAYQVFLIPKPSYMLDIHGLRIDLSSHTDFDKLYVINTPPAFSDNVDPSFAKSSYLLDAKPYQTTSSAWPDKSASYISSPFGPETSDAKLGSTIPRHDFKKPYPTTSSAWPDESASYTSLPFGPEISDAEPDSNIPVHDFHEPNTQFTSALSESTPSFVLQAISGDLKQAYPSSTGWYDAAFIVQWELDQYLETELDFDPKAIADENMLESVLTVTATANAAYATTARSYIEREWPDDRALLLRHLRQWARSKGSGKSLLLNSRGSVESYAPSSSRSS